MKILFTQFTPPFSQVNTSLVGRKSNPEQKYLQYSDWYSSLRRLSAKGNTVKFISLTKQSERFSITHDGYEAVFFPIDNPDEKVKDGRWDFHAPELVDWVKQYDPDVIHIVGTGHLMALQIMSAGFGERTCMWERCALQPYKYEWQEYALCRHLVLPTVAAVKVAAERLPVEKLINFPLGCNTTLFAPDKGVEKKFDIITVGGRGAKKIEVIRDIVKRHSLSWLHLGSITKGWPFSKIEDVLFFNNIRRRLELQRVKKAKSYPYVCGYYDNCQMPGLYNQARLLVHASLSEGAPRCVQEALACEVPVVVLKETVPYVEKEFGVACKTHDEFEGAVLGILGDEERRVEMGRAGREWIVENHSPERLYEAVRAVNEKIVAER